MSEKGEIYIDTNIFLRFLVSDKTNPRLSKYAKSIIGKIKNGKICAHTNVCVVSELVYVLEGYYKLSKNEVLEKTIPLLSMDSLFLEGKSLIITALYVYHSKKVDFEDAYAYVSMNEKNIKDIYTFDVKHFKRFEGINIRKK